MTQRETFVLKLLRVQEAHGWRVTFSLRNIKSDEAHTFRSIDELTTFLEYGGADTHGPPPRRPASDGAA